MVNHSLISSNSRHNGRPWQRLLIRARRPRPPVALLRNSPAKRSLARGGAQSSWSFWGASLALCRLLRALAGVKRERSYVTARKTERAGCLFGCNEGARAPFAGSRGNCGARPFSAGVLLFPHRVVPPLRPGGSRIQYAGPIPTESSARDTSIVPRNWCPECRSLTSRSAPYCDACGCQLARISALRHERWKYRLWSIAVGLSVALLQRALHS